MPFGNSLSDEEEIRSRVLIGLFLCSAQSDESLKQLCPQWDKAAHLSVVEKLDIIQEHVHSLRSPFISSLTPDSVFPWKSSLSDDVDYPAFCQSFFTQPDLFVRIRPGLEHIVTKKLNEHSILYQQVDDHCLAIKNATTLDEIVEIEKEAVIQDRSSQKIAEFLEPLRTDKRQKVWDCCAGSGGKSILAGDVLGDIQLSVTDVRKSILINLHKRLAKAGIREYQHWVMDLSAPFSTDTKPLKETFPAPFDLVIADVPCSGSGTWARTPEQLYFWEQNKIQSYLKLQEQITANIIPFVKPGGYLLYITCSVFKEENEMRVENLISQHHLRLIKMKIIDGYDHKADSMFAALLQKNEG